MIGCNIVDGFDRKYEDLRRRSERQAPEEIVAALQLTHGQGTEYQDLWPLILERNDLSENAFRRIVHQLATTGVLTIAHACHR